MPLLGETLVIEGESILTVKLVDAVIPPELAEILVVPVASAVRAPVRPIEAICGAAEAH